MSDFENTPAFRALLISKVDHLDECMDELKKGTWDKINDHEVRMTKVEVSLGLLVKASWMLFATSMGVVIVAAWRLILR